MELKLKTLEKQTKVTIDDKSVAKVWRSRIGKERGLSREYYVSPSYDGTISRKQASKQINKYIHT
jgi:hypothetical protein